MQKIVIYTTKTCPYCIKAKSLFNQKKVAFEEIDVSSDSEMRDLMIEKSGGRKTVPQIFIGNYHVGGCDDLYSLEGRGELDSLLA